MKISSPQSQRGNALFIILIAVALLAALNYAVVRNRTTKTNSAPDEQAALIASELIQHGQAVRLALDKMFIAAGGGDNTPTLFAANGAHANYGVPGTAPTAEVFNVAGGGVYFSKPPQGACTSSCAYEFTGQVSLSGAGDEATPDLVMSVSPITPAVCAQINKVQKNDYVGIPGEAGFILDRFAGIYGGPNAIPIGNGISPRPKGFCYRDMLSGGAYIFLYLLRAR